MSDVGLSVNKVVAANNLCKPIVRLGDLKKNEYKINANCYRTITALSVCEGALSDR